MKAIPCSHPRYASLRTRQALVEGYEKGLVSEEGLIAQGRGEAFDYLLGEQTGEFARRAIRAAVASLLLAKRPVISVNGNLAALSPKGVVGLAKATGARIEVNLFYRTEKRVRAIARHLEQSGAKGVLGAGKGLVSIPELFSQRRKVSKEGIYEADVVLLAMEDGDRTRALRRMGKRVIAIDLNPLSVTAQEADITIVDNVVRARPALVKEANGLKKAENGRLLGIVRDYDNRKALKEALARIRRGVA
jgi:4-phosphopantoate--beta-alanine ligase